MMARIFGAAALSAALVAVSAPAAVAAQPTAVLLELSGWRGKQARSAVLFGVAPEVEVVARSEARRAANEGGYDLRTREGMVAIANDLGLSLVVTGAVHGRGRRAKTTIRVLDASGRLLESGRTVGPTNASARKKIGRLASRLVRRALARIEPAKIEPADDEPRRVVRPIVAAAAVDDGDDESLGLDPAIDEEDEIDEADVAPPPPKVARDDGPTKVAVTRGRERAQAWQITALSGIAVRSRTARIGQTDDRDARHASGAFPELAVQLRITPFDPGSFLGPAYIDVAGYYGLGLSSLQNTEDVSTDAYRFSFDIGYTVPVEFLQIGGTIGAGHDAFTLGSNDVMGAARYTYVRLGGVARWPLSETFELFGEVGLRPIFDVGELGSRYGQGAGAFGFDAAVGLLGRTRGGFSYGLTASVDAYALLFSEPGELSGAVTATGGIDSSLILGSTIGWAF